MVQLVIDVRTCCGFLLFLTVQLALVGQNEAAVRVGSSRYSSYRSSYSSYRYSYSSYYSISIRYSPVYYGGYYYYWYYYYRPSYYLSSPSDADSGVTVCLNTVVGDNGTMLGYFMCPFYNEPNDYTYCCGQSDAQYCCRFADDPGRLGGLIAGIVIGVLVIVGIIVCIIVICKRRSRRPPTGQTTTVTYVQSSQTEIRSHQMPADVNGNGYSNGSYIPAVVLPSASPTAGYNNQYATYPSNGTTPGQEFNPPPYTPYSPGPTNNAPYPPGPTNNAPYPPGPTNNAPYPPGPTNNAPYPPDPTNNAPYPPRGNVPY